MSFPLKTADGAGWSIDAVASAEGVDIVLAFDLNGVPAQATLTLERPEARTLAHKVLAAGGDGTERTFVAGINDAVPSAKGVVLALRFGVAGVPTQAELTMSRSESRTFAQRILAAAGNAMERTFVPGGDDAVSR